MTDIRDDLSLLPVRRDGDDHLAVIAPEQRLGRTELLDTADRIAMWLARVGVGGGDTVAVCLESGVHAVVGALGVAAAGAVLVPVEPGASRLSRWQLVSRHKVAALISRSRLLERMSWPAGLVTVSVDLLPDEVGQLPAVHRPDLAAVLTDDRQASVPVRHADVTALADDIAQRFALSGADRILTTAPLSSGRVFGEVFATVLAGVSLVFMADVYRDQYSTWLDVLAREQITILAATPTQLDLLLSELAARDQRLPDSVRLVLLSGERLDPALVPQLRERASERTDVAYFGAAYDNGPWTACLTVRELSPDWPSVPVGTAMAGQRIRVLSETGAVCPPWVVGRIHYGGLAAQADSGIGEPVWAADPETGERLLRTEQFGRLLPSDLLEVVGHTSAQVEVYGRRLQLGDTEVALGRLPSVRDAVVVSVADGTGIAAFVRPDDGAVLDEQELLDDLRRKVSPYLLPERVQVRDNWPLTLDGRVDRAALAALGEPPPVPVAVPVAENDQELVAAVVAIACRILGLAEIDPAMNLFDLGATSVELVRLATAVEAELGVSVPVGDVLRFPSVSVMVARHLGAAEAEAEAVSSAVDAPADDTAVLTGLVARQVFKDRHVGIRHEFDGTEGVRLGGSPDRRMLARRTIRRFGADAVPFDALAAVLGALRAVPVDGESRRWYPSAGSAYPMTAYLSVVDGKVADVPAGAYYLHPERNELVALGRGRVVPVDAHAEINRAVAARSAFSVYLVARLAAITPLYDDNAWDFAVFEAGAMAQVLMTAAAEAAVGLCPVGTMDAAVLTDVFELGDSDRFVHALIGGNLPGVVE